MRPKFEVGEVVILQSKNYPEQNGEYTVLDVRYGNFREVSTGELSEEAYSYLLDDGGETPWSEVSLRKKHIPGELSFTDLMASLSSPVLITHQP